MPKKPRRPRKVFDFTVAEVFPPSDPMAIDLLRLMAIHNDLSFVADWMRAHLKPASRPGTTEVAASRWFFLQRLFSALVAELVATLGTIENASHFRKLESALDRDGRGALGQLRAVQKDRAHPVFKALHRTRNKAAFHFDAKQFKVALNRMLADWGQDTESILIYEPEPDGKERGRIYYALADQVTTEISFGLPRPGQSPLDHEMFHAAIDLHGALTQFIESAVSAYMRLRGLGNVLRERLPQAPQE